MSIDRVFSLMYRRELMGATLCGLLRRMHLYGIVAKTLEKIDFNAHKYDALPRFNIVVCANLSAGKSTLVNALLGKDLLPSRNEATTAKITSVYDRDGMKKVFGCSVARRDTVSISTCADVDASRIVVWNADDKVNRILLQSDLNGIGNRSSVVVVHDTPGTNYSANPIHREITMDFLRAGNMDALLYVVNFENMRSDDQDSLLRDVYSLKKCNGMTPIVFAVNKIDSADAAKENVAVSINEFDKYVRGIGFSNFVIVPVAAKAGRLLKMALLGNAQKFTVRENDDFDVVFRKFSKRMNARDIWPASLACRNCQPTYGCRAARVNIAGVSYDTDCIAAALANTGIPALENLLENLNLRKSNKEDGHG